MAKTFPVGPDGEELPTGTKTKDLPTIEIKYKNQRYLFTDKEFASFKKVLCARLNKGVVEGLKQRTKSAQRLHEFFAKINQSNSIVAFVVESTKGAKLPDLVFISKAEQAIRDFESAIKGGDFKKVKDAGNKAALLTNTAINEMTKYRSAMMGGAESWVATLEMTKDLSFAFVSGCALTMLATAGVPLVLAGATVGGGDALLKAIADEGGKALAGAKDQTAASAWWSIWKQSLAGSVVGAVVQGKGGAKVVDGVSKQIVLQSRSTVLKKFAVSDKSVHVLVRKMLNGSALSGLETAVQEAFKLLNDPKAKPEDFFATVAKKMIEGGLMVPVEDAVKDGLVPSIIESIAPGERKSTFGKMAKSEAEKKLGEIILNKYKGALGKKLDEAFNAASGKEDPKVLVKTAGKKFAGSPTMKKVKEDFKKKHGKK